MPQLGFEPKSFTWWLLYRWVTKYLQRILTLPLIYFERDVSATTYEVEGTHTRFKAPVNPGGTQRHQQRGQRQPHFLTRQPTCGRMHSWQGAGVIRRWWRRQQQPQRRGVISTTMTIATTTTKTMSTTTQGQHQPHFWHNDQPVVVFIPGREAVVTNRGGDFKDDNDGNNAAY